MLPIVILSLIISCIFPPLFFIGAIALFAYAMIIGKAKESADKPVMCVCKRCGYYFESFYEMVRYRSNENK